MDIKADRDEVKELLLRTSTMLARWVQKQKGRAVKKAQKAEDERLYKRYREREGHHH
jgi:hypothetical protein